jgi:hypothetical protein
MTASRLRLGDLLILLAIAAVGVGTWLVQPEAELNMPLSDCDLNRESCVARLPEGGSIEFAIEPRPVPTLKPLKLSVAVSGRTPAKVEVDFAGVSMNMGYNRPALAAVGAGRYEGQATLPVCVSGAMDWQATVLIEDGGRTISIPFRFRSGRS